MLGNAEDAYEDCTKAIEFLGPKWARLLIGTFLGAACDALRRVWSEGLP